MKPDPIIGDSQPIGDGYLTERTVVTCPECGCQRLLREWTEKTGYELMIRGYKYNRARTVWGEIEDGGEPQPYVCPNCESFRKLDQILPEWRNMNQHEPPSKNTLVPYINPGGLGAQKGWK